MKANADKSVILEFIKQNDAKPRDEQLTRKEMGERFGVSAPRISQIAAELKVKSQEGAEAANDESNAPEAA